MPHTSGLWCNCGRKDACLPVQLSSTTTVKNAKHTVGRPRSATPDGQWHAKRPHSSSSLKSSCLLLERYFPKLAVHNGRGFFIQQTESARPCCVLRTHSRAAERPLAASLPATPAFRGAANDPEFDRATNSWDTASVVHLPQSIYPSATCALVHIECHGSPSVAKHGSISNSESFLDRGSAGSLRTPRNKSTVHTAAASVLDHLAEPDNH